MYYVLEVSNGPEYFQEYCYSEVIDVRDRLCITSIPESASQLQAAYVFRLLGEFEKEHEAREFMIQYKEKRDNPVISTEAFIKKEIKKENDDNKNKPVKWYGNGKITVA